MNAMSSSPEQVRVHTSRGGAGEILRHEYHGARPTYYNYNSKDYNPIMYREDVDSHVPRPRPRSPSYLNSTQRRYAEEIRTVDPRMGVEMPYYLRDGYGRYDDKELTRPERGYESYRSRRRSRSYDINLRNRSSSRDQLRRGIMRSVSQKRAQSHAQGRAWDAADIVWSPSSPRDATVHLELDIEDDVESQLEEFSRLVRLGHFKEAEQHFESHLIDHIDLEPVLLGYTDMLLECGNYMKDRPHKAPPPGGDGPVPAQYYGTESENYFRNKRNVSPGKSNNMVDDLGVTAGLLPHRATRIEISVYLRSAYRELYSKGQFKMALKTAEWDELSAYMNARKTDRQLCSSDLQILQYYLKVTSHLAYMSNYTLPRMHLNIWSDRPGFYKSLLSDGRIWDVRDIISASVPALGGEDTWRTFIGADLYSSNFFAAFLRDWNLEEYDASSYLATLDILVTLGNDCIFRLLSSLSQQNIEDAKRVLDHAKRFSTCIKDNNPEYTKSRPYLRWILAEAELERYSADFKNDTASAQWRLKSFPGLTVWLSALPVYIPISSENPGWCISTLQGNSTDLLQTGLEAARDLGDYDIEAYFLRELACRTEDPMKLLAKLGNLQKSTQGDIVGYLQTCLTKYLLAHNEARRQALRDELAEFEDQLSAPPTFARILEDPLMEWCKQRIQIALFRPGDQFSVQLEEAEDAAAAVVADLPQDIMDDLSNMAKRISLSLHQDHSGEDFEIVRDRRGAEAYRPNVQRDEAAKVVAKYNDPGKQENRMKDKETEYRFRLSHDLNISGISKKKAAALLEWVQNPDLQNSTRMSRKDVSLEALKRYNFDYELDKAAPNRVIINRPLRYYEKDFLIERTREIRKRRRESRWFRSNTTRENEKSVEDRITELDSPPYSTASDSDSRSSGSLEFERAGSPLELRRERMSWPGQRNAASPLIVTASPIRPELLELGYKESHTEQPVIQNEKDDGLPFGVNNEPQVDIDDGPQVEEIDDGPPAERIDDGPQVEEIDNGPLAEKIDDGPQAEEIDNGPPVGETDDGPQVEIVNPPTHDKNGATDDSGSRNTKNTASNDDNEAKSSEQDPKMEPPQRSK